jgi:hypothetical protein
MTIGHLPSDQALPGEPERLEVDLVIKPMLDPVVAFLNQTSGAQQSPGSHLLFVGEPRLMLNALIVRIKPTLAIFFHCPASFESPAFAVSLFACPVDQLT